MILFEQFSEMKMKICIIWCICSSTCFNSFANSKSIEITEDWYDEWNSFKDAFDKNYNTEEEKYRMEIFKENFFKIHEHNERYAKGDESYSLGINQFSDLLHEEYLRIVNSPSPDISELTLLEPDDYSILPQKAIPKEKNWVADGKVTPVGDQGKCNAGWAFSVAGALESAKAIKDGAAPVELSEQNLIECSEGFGNDRCSSGNLGNTYEYIYHYGIEKEVSYRNNFQKVSSQCRYDPNKLAVRIKRYAAFKGTEVLLKIAVAKAPVSVYINPTLPSFKNYKGDIYDDPQCDNSTGKSISAVLVVGYGTDNNMDYWLIKNSLGTAWGEKGYMRLARNRNNLCGIANLIYYPLVN